MKIKIFWKHLQQKGKQMALLTQQKYRKILLPIEYVPSICHINFDQMIDNGIKYVVIDLDGTMTPFDSQEVPEQLISFINELKQKVNVGIYSDGSKERVEPVAEKLAIPCVCRARKPIGSFEVIRQMFGEDCNPNNTMLIGNTFLDIILANRLGMYNVLVDTLREDFNYKEAVCDVLHRIVTHPVREEFQEYGRKK